MESNIGDLKAPSGDGFLAIFYKQFWVLIAGRVRSDMLNVLNRGEMLSGWNDTVIVLIPKTEKLEKIKDLWPISLSTVLHKIISKVIANRLKLVTPHVISPSQSTFVPRRLITNNALLLYEVTHYLKNKRSGSKGVTAIKLDMSKAYNRVK